MLPDAERARGEAARRTLGPTLGTVRAAAGTSLTVEFWTTGGAAFAVDAPAILHADYQPGDTVLLLHLAEEPGSVVVVGRVGNPGDRVTGANLLALLLGVDGGGSGLDADTLDGEHEATLVRADGSRPLSGDWDTGAGHALRTARVGARAGEALRLETDGGALWLVIDTAGRVGVGTAAPGELLEVAGSARIGGTLATTGTLSPGAGIGSADAAVSVGNGRTAAGFAYVELIGDTTYTDFASRWLRENGGANARTSFVHRGTGDFSFRTMENGPIVFATQSAERVRIRNGGVALCGPGASFEPQGLLHLHDGTGGWLHASKTAVGATAQTLLADGAGDVTQMVRVDALVSNGTARVFVGFALETGGTTTYNATVGAETFQFRLTVGGALDVRRTAGTAAGTVVVRALWL